MIYVLHQQNNVPIQVRNQSKNPACSAFSFKSFACGAFFSRKILPAVLAAHACHQKILSVGHLISVSCLVYQFIGIDNDSNTILCDHNNTICKNRINKVSNNKSSVGTNLVKCNSHNKDPIPKQFIKNKLKTNYVITRTIIQISHACELIPFAE